MSRVLTYHCDGPGCERRTEWVEGTRLAGSWTRTRWVPGLLTNTKPKPDRHFCSEDCWKAAEEKKEKET